MVKLSVVMPTYDDEKYLPEAVNAILSQSFQDFELIIVNDCSPDNSDAIIKEFMKQDKRIRYFVNETNQGCVKSANRGFHEARGEYLFAASSDDKILPGFFEKTISQLTSNPSIPLCVGEVGYFYDHDPEVIHSYKSFDSIKTITVLNKEEALKTYQRYHFEVCGAAAICKTEEARKRGFYDAELGKSCDHVLLNSMALAEGVIYVPQTFSLMRLFSTERLPRSTIIQMCDNYISNLKKRPEIYRSFSKSTLLARNINSRYYTVFLRPKHWNIVVPMVFTKLRLLFRKILNRLNFIPLSSRN